MANRTTVDEVKALVPSKADECQIEALIQAANAIVTSKAGCIGGDAALLAQIELQLTAHFIASVDPAVGGVVMSSRFENMSMSFATGRIGQNINRTAYGTIANGLAGGCLGTLGNAAATVDFL